jgi:hypothetical protein
MDMLRFDEPAQFPQKLEEKSVGHVYIYIYIHIYTPYPNLEADLNLSFWRAAPFCMLDATAASDPLHTRSGKRFSVSWLLCGRTTENGCMHAWNGNQSPYLLIWH